MFKFQLNVPVFFYILGKFSAGDKGNLKAKNIFVLERQFLDLRKNILSNSKITLWATLLLIEQFEQFKSSKSKPSHANMSQS